MMTWARTTATSRYPGRYDGDGSEVPRAADRSALPTLDDGIMEKFMEGEEPTIEEIKAAIRKGTIANADSFAVLLRHLLPQQGRSAPAGRRRRLHAVSAGYPADQGLQPAHRRGRSTVRSSDEAPFSALAFKIMTDPFVGKLSFFRVYSGTHRLGQLRAQLHEGQA